MEAPLIPEQDIIPGPDTTRAFRDALGRFATGVTIVTTRGLQGPVGITANSFAALSLDPPLILWSPAKTSRRFATFAQAQGFAVHVLAEDQSDLCHHFARPDHDFSGLDVTTSAHGVPLINGCLARYECEAEATHDGGDHIIIVGRVLRATFTDAEPLIFSKGRYGRFIVAP